MDAIFLNSKSSTASDPHRLLDYCSNLQTKQSEREVINVFLYQILAYITHRKIPKSHKNDKHKISVPRWKNEFELPDGSYFLSDIQDYFEHTIKKRESARMYVNKTKNGITIKIKIVHFLEILTLETMKSLGSTKIRSLTMQIMNTYLI